MSRLGALLFLTSFVAACSAPYVEGDPIKKGPRAAARDVSSSKSSSSEGSTDAEPSSETGGDETTQHTEGMPEFKTVTYFSADQGFPIYLSHLLGSRFHLFGKVDVTNPTAVPQRLLVRGQLVGFTKSPSVATVNLAPGETKSFSVDATLDFAALARVMTPVNANIEIALETPEGKVLNARTKSITLLPKNTVLFNGLFADPGGIEERKALFGALTTPRDRTFGVQVLVEGAAKHSRFGAMIGYGYHTATSTRDDDREGAHDQLGAIYAALKERGFNFTTVPPNFFRDGQNVRYPGESLFSASGNCLDGSLVFASALDAIGMEPFIMFMPGHAYVGVALGPPGSESNGFVTAVETTMLATADYDAAVDRGLEQYRAREGTEHSFITLPEARNAGYLPSPL